MTVPFPYQGFLSDEFYVKTQSVVQCSFLKAICHGPMKVSNSGLHALSRADVIICLAVQRRLTGQKDEQIPHGFPVLNSQWDYDGGCEVLWSCHFVQYQVK